MEKEIENVSKNTEVKETQVLNNEHNSTLNDPTHGDTISNYDDNTKRKEHTRSTMALLFVLGFFALLFLCFVYSIKVNASLESLKDTLVAVIGSLSGIFGFIVGYYYKSSQEQ